MAELCSLKELTIARELSLRRAASAVWVQEFEKREVCSWSRSLEIGCAWILDGNHTLMMMMKPPSSSSPSSPSATSPSSASTSSRTAHGDEDDLRMIQVYNSTIQVIFRYLFTVVVLVVSLSLSRSSSSSSPPLSSSTLLFQLCGWLV